MRSRHMAKILALFSTEEQFGNHISQPDGQNSELQLNIIYRSRVNEVRNLRANMLCIYIKLK